VYSVSLFSVLPSSGLMSVHSVYCNLTDADLWRKKKKTRSISPYTSNWLVFVTDTECVHCAVRTEYLYVIQVKLNLCTSVVPSQYHSTSVPHSSSSTCSSYQDKSTEPVKPPEKQSCFVKRGALDREVLNQVLEQ
jgi:hypothetical protein